MKLIIITSKLCSDIMTPIHKGGTESGPDNYHEIDGISVMNSLLKMLHVRYGHS